MRTFRRKLFRLWRWRTRPQLWERCLGSVCPPSAAPISGSRRPSQSGNLVLIPVFVSLTSLSSSGAKPSLFFLCPWSGEALRGLHLPGGSGHTSGWMLWNLPAEPSSRAPASRGTPGELRSMKVSETVR